MNIFLISLSIQILFSKVITETARRVNNISGRSADLAFWMFFAFLILIRDRGWDYTLYKDMYDNLTALNLLDQWTEPGYLAIMLATKYIGLTFNQFNFITAALNMYLLKKACDYFNTNPIIALFIFVLFYYFRFPYGQIRQSLSMALFIYSLSKIRDSTGYYILINLFASLIHASAFLGFPFFIIYKTLVQRKYLYLVFSLILFVILLLYRLNFYDELSQASFIGKLEYYSGLEDQKASILFSTQLPLILITLASILLVAQSIKLEQKLVILIFAYAFGCLIFLLFSFDLRLADRMSSQFLALFFIITTKAYMKISGYARFACLIALSALGALYLINEFLMMQNQVLEYTW